jgi:nitrite reductase (cytochrome c-552)
MRWHPFFWLSTAAIVFLSVVFMSTSKAQQPAATPPQPPAQPAQPAAAVSNDVCLKCHKPIAKIYKDGFHAGLQCMQCHPKGATHVEDIDTPADTDYRWEACGSCHKYQYETMKMDDPVKVGPFGGTPADPHASPKTNDFPLLNKLIAGHGFTNEYNEERSHKYLLKDHIDIKRKQNAACLNCKSTAVAYNWNSDWKGIKLNATADWKEVIARIPKETMDYGMACSHCHDPHAPRLRIIRAAMIEAIEKRGVNPYWPEKNAKSFEEADEQQQKTLVCAQCHVEYTCGPGSDKVVRDHFPWRKMRDLDEHYRKEFNYQQDWKHALTGESLIKSQHPETETFWESKYERAGASCASCHMPKLTWGGKTFTSHWMTSPYKYLDRYLKGDKQYGAYPCAQCHPTIPPEKLMAQAQRVQKHVFEVQKNAQEALSDCIDAIAAAKKAAEGGGTVDAAKLAEAVKHHQLAHVRWENLVVSENSMGFHNPEEVLMELGKAIDFARKAQLLALQAVKPSPPAAAKTATQTTTKPVPPPKPKTGSAR